MRLVSVTDVHFGRGANAFGVSVEWHLVFPKPFE